MSSDIEDIRNDIDDTMGKLNSGEVSSLTLNELRETNKEAAKEYSVDFQEDFKNVDKMFKAVEVDENGYIKPTDKNIEIMEKAQEITDKNYAALEG